MFHLPGTLGGSGKSEKLIPAESRAGGLFHRRSAGEAFDHPKTSMPTYCAFLRLSAYAFASTASTVI